MKNLFAVIYNYLKDWKNWLVHGLIGVALLIVVIWVPIQWWIKLIVIVFVILFNITRMRLDKKKKNDESIEKEKNH